MHNHTDGPFATVARAIEAHRQARIGLPVRLQKDSPILVRGGCYFLDQPVILTPDNSNLTILAFPGEHPVLSGGQLITNWHETTLQGRLCWQAEVSTNLDFHELWVNGNYATRARHPNRGYFPITEILDKPANWEQGHSRFRFRDGDLTNSAGLANAEIIAMTRWVESRLPIISLDETQHIVNFSKRSVFELQKGDVYYAEGALAWLDEPGEWSLDRASGRVYYLPRPGETLTSMIAVRPALAQVLRFEGHPETNQFVSDITLRGLTFSHTEWYFPPEDPTAKAQALSTPADKLPVAGFAQAAYAVPGAVWGQGVRNCTITDCKFQNLANYGLEFTSGCQSNRILHCEFSDLGAGGIKLGEPRVHPGENLKTSANEICDCHLHDGGFLFPSAVGIWLGQSPDNRITHNHIHDFYYTGISIGWTWGYTKPAQAGGNLVAYNHVHHIGVKSDGDGPILSDMGGIYTLGRQPGTAIINNLWHDIAGRSYGGWGIYFDEGTSGILAASNLVYRTTHGGFHQHYGETNRVFNNIFAFGRDAQIQRTRPEAHLSFSFETNIVYFDSGVLLTGDWAGDKYVMDHNLYFDTRGSNAFNFAGLPLDQWRKRGHDLDSLIADPLFTDPANDNFTMINSSPAHEQGFHPINIHNVGPQAVPQITR